MTSMKLVKRVAPFVCSTCRHKTGNALQHRAFTTVSSNRDESNASSSQSQQRIPASPAGQRESVVGSPKKSQDALAALVAQRVQDSRQGKQPAAIKARSQRPAAAEVGTQDAKTSSAQRGRAQRGAPTSLLDIFGGDYDPEVDVPVPMQRSRKQMSMQQTLPHKLHVYAHRRNTHMTLVQAPRLASETVSSDISNTTASAVDRKKQVDVLLSKSTGDIGFRKAGRGSYDAAFQLGAFFLEQMKERGMFRDLSKLEVIMRGFGPGREAIQKILLGSEGRNLRDRIVSVADATRLKIGGCRSRKPRRLG